LARSHAIEQRQLKCISAEQRWVPSRVVQGTPFPNTKVVGRDIRSSMKSSERSRTFEPRMFRRRSNRVSSSDRAKDIGCDPMRILEAPGIPAHFIGDAGPVRTQADVIRIPISTLPARSLRPKANTGGSVGRQPRKVQPRLRDEQCSTSIGNKLMVQPNTLFGWNVAPSYGTAPVELWRWYPLH